MNKRQRKKHRTGEFVQWGFSIKGQRSDWANAESNEEFMDAVIDLVVRAGMLCGGGCNSTTFEFVVYRYGTHGSNDADRDLMDEFLMGCKHVKEYTVSKLFDVNSKHVKS